MNFEATPHLTPEIGVKALIRRFGGAKHVCAAINAMGFRLNLPTVRKWVREDSIPEHYYQALSSLLVNEKTSVNRGYLEFYFKGVPIGKLYLQKDITVVTRGKTKE